MHLSHLLVQRFRESLATLTSDVDNYAAMIRGTSDPKHGDYQSNAAMPLAKSTVGNSNPRAVAQQLVQSLKIDDLCETPEIAGPGFINLRFKDEFLLNSMKAMLGDQRLGVTKAKVTKPIIIDFSSPNVAKPMHVGHIRSTVIGDSLSRVLRFMGYPVITDNHLGDWGTQFGIIIYGYKHFGNPEVVDANPVPELAKLYRLTQSLIEYHAACKQLETIDHAIAQADSEVLRLTQQMAGADAKDAKKIEKTLASAQKRVENLRDEKESLEEKRKVIESNPTTYKYALAHPHVADAVLQETAKLHEGDVENKKLWEKFLPHCQDEINRVYDRLQVQFDHTLGESFYHPMLAGVVHSLESAGLAKPSDGAMCVFLDGFDAPMIVRKKDGAYLYATTDLATLQYRRDEFDPSEILYVVDTRQGEHFEKLFALADHLGLSQVKLVHVNFGTVLGSDGRPMKTRSGSLIGLESLLDDAVQRAREVVCDPERLTRFDPPMDETEQEAVSETVGIGAIKFADLSHYRTSDYKFDLEKMVALEGSTATYVQYQYARTQSILANAELAESDVQALVASTGLAWREPQERALALRLLQFEDALQATYQDYAPNQLAEYLIEAARAYARFNDQCHVLSESDPAVKATRLMLVTLAGRTLQTGLGLLGIGVAGRM
jgi:arginyl-tRNA synthetase